MIEVADVLNRSGRHSSQKLANELLSFQQKTVLTGADMSMHLQNFLKCKELRTSAVPGTLRGVNFERKTMTLDKDLDSEVEHMLYTRDVRDVLRNQVQLPRSDQDDHFP